MLVYPDLCCIYKSSATIDVCSEVEKENVVSFVCNNIRHVMFIKLLLSSASGVSLVELIIKNESKRFDRNSPSPSNAVQVEIPTISRVSDNTIIAIYYSTMKRNVNEPQLFVPLFSF